MDTLRHPSDNDPKKLGFRNSGDAEYILILESKDRRCWELKGPCATDKQGN